MNTNFVSRYSVNFRRNENIGLLEDGFFSFADECERSF